MAANWSKIKAEYIRGGTSYRKLAEKYSVPFSALRRRAKSEKWTDLRTQSEHKASTKMINKIASQEAKKAVDLADIAELLARKIQENIENGTYLISSKDAYYASSAMRNLRELSREKAVRDCEEQLARIDKLRKEAKAEEENKEIKVVIADDLKDYSQ